MSGNKLRVFYPGKTGRYEGVSALEKLIHSQIDVLTEEQLQADKSLGKGVKVAFHCGPLAKLIFEYKEGGVLPDLGLVCNHGVGVNHIPFDMLKKLGLRLTNTPDVLSDSCADMALALMLASGRQFRLGIHRAMELKAEEKLQVWAGDPLELGQDISYATLGIVGMGSIGYKIALRAKAFNMNIHYHNRTQRSQEDEETIGATYHSNLMSMLPLCDFVIISCPQTPHTIDMFKSAEFKAMKSTAHLINVARGAIVNTDDLVEALNTKEISAAALDVTEPEPLPDNHPLTKLRNVIVVPHWGTAAIQTRAKMLQLMIDNAKAFVEGKPLLTEIKL